jgi:hypothetical protein
MGVKEYFLYDPTDEYLKPSLQGFRFDCGIYTRIQPDETGALACDELDITLRLAKRNLVMSDRRSGEVLHTEAEAERAGRKRAVAARRAAETARQEAEAARQAEIAARKAAEARAAELEAELRRLRDQRER